MTASPIATPTTGGQDVRQAAPQRRALGRLLHNPLALSSTLVLLVIAGTAVFASLLSPHSPTASSVADTLAPISSAHPLGADGDGVDELSRLLYAGRASLLGAVLALAIAMVIGVPTGLIAGYYGRAYDAVSNWVMNLLLSLPAIVVLLAVRAVAGPSMWISMSVFGLLIAPSFYRLTRSSVSAVRGELYVDAARVSGLSDARIISRHVLTVIRAPIVIQAAIVAGVAVAVQAGLEFLGIGDTTVPTWGNLLNDGFQHIYTDPLLLLWPALVIALTCTALALLGTALRDALEDRTRQPSAGPQAQQDKTAAISVVAAAQPDLAVLGSEVESDLLSIRNLGVGYGDTQVVHDVSFQIRPGEIVGLVGESGSGKTQTAFAVMGLLPKGGRVTHGQVSFDGTDLLTLTPAQRQHFRGRQIGYVPQEPMSNLDPSFTVGSQLTEPLRAVMGLSRADAAARALDLLGRVGIADPAKTFRAYPHEISGGMAQRVLIAGAISCDPRLLIADEPTTALDVTVQAEILDLLRDLQAERGMGVLLVTHNFGVVSDLCDSVVVMQHGRVVESGDVRSVLRTPKHEYTQMLLASSLEAADARPAFDRSERMEMA